MRATSPVAVFCLLLLAHSLAGAAPPEKGADKAKDLIVGKWVPDGEKSRASFVIEFTKDNKILVQITEDDEVTKVGAVTKAKGSYTFVKEAEVAIEVEYMGEKKKETLTVTINKDEMTTVDSNGKKDTFKRVK